MVSIYKIALTVFFTCALMPVDPAWSEVETKKQPKLSETEIKKLGDDYDKYIKKPDKLMEIAQIFERQGDYAQAIGIYLDILKRFQKYKYRDFLKDHVKHLREDQKSDYTVTLSHTNGEKTSDEEFLELRATCFALKMPLKVYVHSHKKLKGYQPIFEKILRNSYKHWTSATNGTVHFQFVDSASKADIECFWTDKKADLHDNAAAGITKYCSIGKSKIYLLTISFGKPVSQKFMRNCCIHEIGHTLGLSHSRNADDIMCGFNTKGEPIQKLSKLDVDRCLKLYSKEQINKVKPKLKDRIKFHARYAWYLADARKDYRRAQIQIKNALDINPESEVALLKRIDILILMKEYNNSIKELTNVMKLKPSLRRLNLARRANLYVLTDEYKLARLDYVSAIKSSYLNPDVYSSLAILKILNDNDINVLSELNEALRRSHFDPYLYKVRSLVHLLKSDIKSFIDDSIQYLKLDRWRDKDPVKHALLLYYCQVLINDLEGAKKTLSNAKKHCSNQVKDTKDTSVEPLLFELDLKSMDIQESKILNSIKEAKASSYFQSKEIRSWIIGLLKKSLVKICQRSIKNSS